MKTTTEKTPAKTAAKKIVSYSRAILRTPAGRAAVKTLRAQGFRLIPVFGNVPRFLAGKVEKHLYMGGNAREERLVQIIEKNIGCTTEAFARATPIKPAKETPAVVAKTVAVAIETTETETKSAKSTKKARKKSK